MTSLRYTHEDFSQGTPPRVFGSETEYTSRCFGEDDNHPYSYLNHLTPSEYTVSFGRNEYTSAVFKNGSELYLDMNALLEFATAECLTPLETLAQEKAGEILVAKTAQVIATKSDTGNSATFKRSGYAFRKRQHENDVSIEPMSTGHHENYYCLIRQSEALFPNPEKHEAYKALASFLTTRPLWAGAGMVTHDGYAITQKSNSINYTGYGSLTSEGSKTPLRFHDDRLEVRSGDGNMSEWAIVQKYALTSLVLRLVEHGTFPKRLLLKYPNIDAHHIAVDPFTRVWPIDSKPMLAIDHQKAIIDEAYQQFVDTIPEYEETAVYEFETFYRDFKKSSIIDNNVEPIADRVDWAAKFASFNHRGLQLEDMTNRDLQQVMYDLKWEQLGNKKIGRQLLTSAEIASSMAAPPKSRAMGRVAAAKELMIQGQLGGVDWEKVDDIYGDTYKSFPDPFATYTHLDHKA